MTHDLDKLVTAWLGDGRRFISESADDPGDLARVIDHSFRHAHAGIGLNSLDLLEAVARACGFPNIERMLGGAICLGSGGLDLTLVPSSAGVEA